MHRYYLQILKIDLYPFQNQFYILHSFSEIVLKDVPCWYIFDTILHLVKSIQYIVFQNFLNPENFLQKNIVKELNEKFIEIMKYDIVL